MYELHRMWIRLRMFVFSSIYVFFFFKQKTAYEMRISDWSSDVCSSDLLPEARHLRSRRSPRRGALQEADGEADGSGVVRDRSHRSRHFPRCHCRTCLGNPSCNQTGTQPVEGKAFLLRSERP